MGQAPRAGWLCFVLVIALAACQRRGPVKGAGQQLPLASDNAAAPTAPPSPAANPPMKTLPTTPPPPASQGVRRGGTLRIHLEAEPPHLDPLEDTLQVIERVVSGLVYEPLIECGDDGYHPGLADVWDISADGLRVSVHLRAGPRWHDDKPFSSLDVQATFERLIRASGRSPQLHAMVADIEGVDILPDRWIRMRLLRPSGLLMRALCEIPILPAEPLRSAGGKPSSLARAPIGTGPFRMAGWERGKRIKLVRSRPLDAADSPRLDEIVFEIDNDPARALTRLRRGEIDLLPRVSDIHYPEQVSQATLRDVLDLYFLSPERYSFVALNTRRGVLADPQFRRALSLLWDRGRFASEFHRGLVRPIGGPTFGAVPPDKFDRVLAAQVLDQAGFQDSDGDGVRDIGRAPIRLSFLVPAGARTLATEVRAYAMDLRRCGILLDTTTVDGATVFARLESGDFDLAALTWEGRKDEDPRLLLSPQGDFEYTGYRPEKLTTLIDQIRVAPLPAARAPLLAQLADLVGTDRPALFLYRHDVPMLVAKRVHGLAAVGDRLDLRSAWVEP